MIDYEKERLRQTIWWDMLAKEREGREGMAERVLREQRAAYDYLLNSKAAAVLVDARNIVQGKIGIASDLRITRPTGEQMQDISLMLRIVHRLHPRTVDYQQIDCSIAGERKAGDSTGSMNLYAHREPSDKLLINSGGAAKVVSTDAKELSTVVVDIITDMHNPSHRTATKEEYQVWLDSTDPVERPKAR